jgi:hypothetical protein
MYTCSGYGHTHAVGMVIYSVIIRGRGPIMAMTIEPLDFPNKKFGKDDLFDHDHNLPFYHQMVTVKWSN